MYNTNGLLESLSPTGSPVSVMNMNSDVDSSTSGGRNAPFNMNILASIFFVLATGWLILALLYTFLAVTFLRIRAQGNLNRIYDEDFGRVQIFRNVNISFGWILRRYIQHMLRGDRPAAAVASLSRYMTREERKSSMKILLNIQSRETCSGRMTSSDEVYDLSGFSISDENKITDCEAPSTPMGGESSNEEEPVCSICLSAYERDNRVFQSKTCPHRFHECCILDWLQRQANVECPCCRVPMVDDEDVWRTVKQIRKERKKKLKLDKRSQKEIKRNIRLYQNCVEESHLESTEESSTDDSDSGIDYSSRSVGILAVGNISSNPNSLYQSNVEIQRLESNTVSSICHEQKTVQMKKT